MTTTQAQAHARRYDLFVVDSEEHPGATVVPVEAGEAADGRIHPRWLPLASRRIRRARAVSLDRATERAGATRVRQAIATAEQRWRHRSDVNSDAGPSAMAARHVG